MQTEKQVSAIFAAIAAHPELFPAKPEQRHKAALDFVTAQFKDKSFNLEKLRAIAQVLGRNCTSAILDSVATNVVASLVAKLDKARKNEAADAGFAAHHLLALAYSEVEPLPPAAKATKTEKALREPKVSADTQPLVRTLHLSKALARKG